MSFRLGSTTGVPRRDIQTADVAAIQDGDVELSAIQGGSSARVAMDRVYELLKRAVDLGGALVGLMLLSPVMLAVAHLIRFDSPGPVLFRQLRRGRRGNLFYVLKF